MRAALAHSPTHSQLTTVSTAVLWRPSRCFESSALVIEAFRPVAGLFGVVFAGCFLAGAIVVAIEMLLQSQSQFFTQGPGSKRKEELRGCAPFGHGFWFAFICACRSRIVCCCLSC